MLARIHVASWQETYTGILPASEIAARPYEVRLAQWERMLGEGRSRVALAEGLGFAQMGPQRDTALAEAGYPDELYALYLLQAGQGRGLGRAMVAAVDEGRAYTALVLATNSVALGFYAAIGGRELERRPEMIGEARVDDVVMGFGAPIAETNVPGHNC